MAKKKRFILKLKGTFVGSKKYRPYKEGDKVILYFRKVDAERKYKELRNSMKAYNKFRHPKQYMTLKRKFDTIKR
jgi:hypothetical protein